MILLCCWGNTKLVKYSDDYRALAFWKRNKIRFAVSDIMLVAFNFRFSNFMIFKCRKIVSTFETLFFFGSIILRLVPLPQGTCAQLGYIELGYYVPAKADEVGPNRDLLNNNFHYDQKKNAHFILPEIIGFCSFKF